MTVHLVIVLAGGSSIAPEMSKECAIEVLRQWINDPDAPVILRGAPPPAMWACRYQAVVGMAIREKDATERYTKALEKVAGAMEKEANKGDEWKSDE